MEWVSGFDAEEVDVAEVKHMVDIVANKVL